MEPPSSDWLAPAAGLAGVGAGWILNQLSARFTRRTERARDVAAEWRDALVRVWSTMALQTAQRAEFRQAGADWVQAWMAYSGAVPRNIADRVEPLHYLIRVFHISSDHLKEGLDRHDQFYAITAANPSAYFQAVDLAGRAFGDALAALDAFIIGRRLPPRGFLSVAEILPFMSREGSEEEDQLLGWLSEAVATLPHPERARLDLVHGPT